MKNAIRWCLSLAGLALMIVACNEAVNGPTSPDQPSGNEGDGSVAALAGPGGGGGAGPGGGGGAGPGGGGGAGPGTGGAGPGSGSSGGGGGGSTPTPTPGGTPTPTTTPVVPCPPTFTVDALNTPRLLSDIGFFELFPPDPSDYDTRCVVQDVRLTMRISTVTGFIDLGPGEDYTVPGVGLGVCGSGMGFTGCSSSNIYRFTFSEPATGNEFGTDCGDFAFDTAAATPFDPAVVTAPYSGTYQLDPMRNGVGRPWLLNGLRYDLQSVFAHPPDAVLECARIEVTTELVP